MWKTFKVIDADGHMHEPQYLWERYVEPKYRDQVPKVAYMDGNFMVYENIIGSDSFRLQKSTHLFPRFMLHVLPDGFIRIRDFGFQANRWVVGLTLPSLVTWA